MHLATSGGVFYRFLMSQLPAQSGAATGPATVIRTGNPSLQLSFSCDSSVLWAQDYENNQWSTVDAGASASEGERERERRERKTAAAAPSLPSASRVSRGPHGARISERTAFW